MRTSNLIITFAVASLVGAGYLADASANECVDNARDQKRACKATCIDDFHTAKFVCRGINPACGNPCLAGKEVCIESVRASLESCIDGCRADLAQDKIDCGAPCDGDLVCDACVDQAQVDAFICRDNCREAFNHDPVKQEELALCKTTFRACIRACG